MNFRRISNLPPYVFTIINNLKITARRDGDDVRRSVRRLDRLPERIERLRVVVVVAATAIFLGLSGVVLVVGQFVSR